MAGWTTDGAAVIGLTTYPQLTGYEKASVDTGYVNGLQASGQKDPATIAAHTFEIAALYAAISGSPAAATAGAATINRPMGLVTSETLTTAAGGTYTLTLTNSLITVNSNIKLAAYLSGVAAVGGPVAIQSVTLAAGSAVIVIKNNGSVALSGTAKILIPFMVAETT